MAIAVAEQVHAKTSAPALDLLDEATSMPAFRMVRPPVRARRAAWGLVAMVVIGTLATFVVPWQQNSPGSGRVVARDPILRPQTIESNIDGMIEEWIVKENAFVEEGAPLVRIQDNDPDYRDRLLEIADAAKLKFEAAKAKAETYEAQIKLYELARTNELTIAQFELDAAEEKVKVYEAKVAELLAELLLYEQTLERVAQLVPARARSQQDLDKATSERDAAKNKVEQARRELLAAQKDRDAKKEKLPLAQRKADAAIGEAVAKKQEADKEVQVARESVQKAESAVADFGQQTVTAPADGYVVRILAAQGTKGRQVKKGDELILFAPVGVEQAVELWVSGLDANLIQSIADVEGHGPSDSDNPLREPSKVRLQFEGWPAVQFAGWPSVAVGTYGGVVQFVDRVDNGKGMFRILVVPDPDDRPWPQHGELRQGMRSNGWVLMGRVSLAYEMWRRLNGFPPAVALDEQSNWQKEKSTNPVKMAK
jgi:multidrug resistance efflux pump